MKSMQRTFRNAVGPALLLFAAALQASPFAYITQGFDGPGNVRVIDTLSNAVAAVIPVGRTPHGVAVDATGRRAYVTNRGDGTVSVIDTATNKVAATVAVGLDPSGVAVNLEGTRVYVANRGSGTISVIEPSRDTVIASIRVGNAPLGLAAAPDGRRVFVANSGERSISVIDAATNSVVATIATPMTPMGLAIDAAGSRVYVTLQTGDLEGAVAVIDTSSLAIVATVKVGASPVGIALNPAGTRAYVANAGEQTSDFYFGSSISVIDTASLAVVRTLAIGRSPRGIAVNPSGTRVYALNADSATMSVMDAATYTILLTLPVGGSATSFGTFIGPANVGTLPANYQGLWWKPSEPGWGVSVAQQGDILFATLFTYDADGSGMWLAMADGKKTGPTTYSGTLFRTTGPSFDANPWDPAAVTTTPVGTAMFAFTDNDNGTFTSTYNGVTQSKAIGRQVFSSPVPTCTPDGTHDLEPNYQDLWWRYPAGSGSGWGVSMAHQGDIVFAVLFTYGATGKGQWLVMSNGARTGADTYAGTLYRTTGPAFDAASWNPAQVKVTPVGTAALNFLTADYARFSYAIDGVAQSQLIMRQAYSSPATLCH